MNTLMVVSIVVAVVILASVAVYLILALIQVRRTAREAEEFLRSLNQDVKKFEHLGEQISAVVSSFKNVPFLFKILGGAVSGLAGFVVLKFRFKKKDKKSDSSSSSCCSGEKD